MDGAFFRIDIFSRDTNSPLLLPAHLIEDRGVLDPKTHE